MEKLNKFTKKINKVYYLLFKEDFQKLDLKFDDVKRWDLIQYLNSNHKFNSYLEIGCDDNQLFSKINISEKLA